MKLYKGDCLIESSKIKSGSVDLILTDLPYGTMKGASLDGWKGTKTDWDTVVDTDKIMSIANRILRKNGKMVLFSQQPFTTELITNSTPNLPFCYSMIWEKDHFANSLVAKKAPVSYYEDLLIFSKKYDQEGLHPLRKYFKKVLDYIGFNLKKINTSLGHRRAEHSFYIGSTQFSLCTQETYNELIEKFLIDKMDGFKQFKELQEINSMFNSMFNSVFNLREGGRYKSNILKYKKDYNGHHPTQKPILLLEDLLNTFSNKGDLVVDFTMGSGSTGVACVNTGRNFIGIEKDEKYFNIAKDRIANAYSPT